MKLLDNDGKATTFNQIRYPRSWDRYKAFHKEVGLFTVFETGELRFERVAPDPGDRKTYRTFNVAVTATTDSDFQFTTPEGELLSKAWLSYGMMQYLIVDLCTRKCVKLRRFNHKANLNEPVNLRSAPAFFAGPGADPVGEPIVVNRPDDVWKRDNKDWLKQVKTIATARVQVMRNVPSVWDQKFVLTKAMTTKPVEEFAAHMPLEDCAKMAKNGVVYPRVQTTYDYLLVKE
jgi:hypothetical protein